ncbi:hypothetical protein FCS83_09850 [Oenococcus sp. UCMA 17063]|nr:hypothetical protein [Oenococcus sp. UCMA 17063]
MAKELIKIDPVLKDFDSFLSLSIDPPEFVLKRNVSFLNLNGRKVMIDSLLRFGLNSKKRFQFFDVKNNLPVRMTCPIAVQSINTNLDENLLSILKENYSLTKYTAFNLNQFVRIS